MVTIRNENNVITLAVLGEFTVKDFKEFEEAVAYQLKFPGAVNLLVDLRDMIDFTMDVAWEEMKFNREHPYDFGKIGVVTDDQWLSWSAWLPRIFTKADVRVFDDFDAARAWVLSPAE